MPLSPLSPHKREVTGRLSLVNDTGLVIPHPHVSPRGFFLCIEGGDGCGKTTQRDLVANRLSAEGRDVTVTREPGGTTLGARLRDLVLHGEDMGERAEALIYAADRAEHVAAVILPALERGGIVVTDRYMDSSIAYQGAARGLGDAVRDLSLWAARGLVPDLTIILDAAPVDVSDRRDAQPDRLEAQPTGFHERVREGFLTLAEAEPQRYCVVDALASVDEVAASIWSALAPRLEEKVGRP